MAKLVIGNIKTFGIPAVVKEKQPVIDTLNVTPSTTAQTITAPTGTDGYSPVNISAVTSSIDANIQAGNIKDGVTILGVTGNYQGGGGTQEPSIVLTGTVVDGKLQSIDTVKSVGITELNGTSVCRNMFDGYPNIKTVDLSSIVIVNGTNASQYMFSGCTGITTVNLSSLTTISVTNSYWFAGCTALTSVNLSSLTTLSNANACYYMFQNCTSLVNVVLPSLTTISGGLACQHMFEGCTSLKSLSFPALTSASFASRTNQFNALIQGVDGCTIHFPSNLDPQTGSTTISSLNAYPTFGGTNTVLAFDLPATE